MYKCYSCSKEIEVNSNQKIDFRETCFKCKKDAHVCLNCEHYERGAYNDCKESQAEKVPNKDKANFCEYFKFTNKDRSQTSDENPLDKLDDLFK